MATSEGRPERIGRYEVLAELGQGAMGIVYKARDPQLERTVAVKTLRRDLGLPPEEYADLRKRFYQEATAAGRLNHPQIVTIHDVVEIGDVPYIVMEFLEGRSLADLIAAEGPLRPARAVALVVQVCGALEYAHAHGVVHRDIKPGNIVVLAGDVAKVSDFGIARIAGSSVTRTGVVVGTPAYMAPEQLRGRVPDGRSDLFSLGVVLYEALTGANPFQCEELTATLYQVVQVDPPPVRAKNPAVSPALARVTAQTLAKEPDQRYPTARALADALGEALARPDAPEAPVGPAARPAGRPARLHARRRLAAVAVGVAVLLAAAGGLTLWSREPAPESPEAMPAAPARRGGRAAARVGEIVVSTNPSVEVFLDGAPQGLTGDAPLVIRDVAAGERRVTLRLGARSHELAGTVPEGQALWLAYRFPEEPRAAPLGKALEAEGQRLLDAARGKLREVLPDSLRDKPRGGGSRPPGGDGQGR